MNTKHTKSMCTGTLWVTRSPLRGCRAHSSLYNRLCARSGQCRLCKKACKTGVEKETLSSAVLMRTFSPAHTRLILPEPLNTWSQSDGVDICCLINNVFWVLLHERIKYGLFLKAARKRKRSTFLCLLWYPEAVKGGRKRLLQKMSQRCKQNEWLKQDSFWSNSCKLYMWIFNKSLLLAMDNTFNIKVRFVANYD